MKREYPYKRWLLCLICFLWSMLPVGAGAEQDEEKIVFVNPAYQDVISSQEILRRTAEIDENSISFYSEPPIFSSKEAAGVYMREMMVNRQEKVSFRFELPRVMNSDEFKAFCWSVAEITWDDEAASSSVEGDYLRYHYGGYTAGRTYESSTGLYVVNYTMVYYTDYEKEQELTERIRQVMDSLNLGGKTDYEKIKAVYGYICGHVTYDHSSDEGTTENKDYGKYTAYNAMMLGTAVCQGYSSLGYRMLREAGVGGRMVPGRSPSENHIWNIVPLDGKYYNLDSTWDANYKEGSYRYFLQNMSDFKNHIRGADFSTAAFNARYPMAEESYHQWMIQWENESTCSLEGTIEKRCIDCGKENVERIPKLPHTLGEYQLMRESTCTEKGYEIQRCSVCGVEENRHELPLRSHTPMSYVTEKESTCTEKGYEVQRCGECYNELNRREFPLKNHTPMSYVTEKESTCTEKGYEVQRCGECGNELNRREFPLKSHSPGSYVTEKESTCTVKGYEVQSCQVCRKELNRRELPLNSHVYSQKISRKASCTEDGIMADFCTVCQAEKPNSRMAIPAKGHSFGQWTTTKKATIFNTGIQSRTCAACGKKENRTLKKLPASVKLNTGNVMIQVGKATTAVKVAKKTAGDSVACWKSSNPSVAIINRTTGKIRALSVGTTYISVTMKSGASAKIRLRVQRSSVKTAKLTLNRTSVTLKRGASFKISVKRSPVTATDKLTFKSNAPKVASVSAGGTVRALKKGTAVITVKTPRGRYARCRVYVK